MNNEENEQVNRPNHEKKKEDRVENFYDQSSTKFGAELNVHDGHDLAVFKDEVYITDTSRHRVLVTDLDGKLQRVIECQDESIIKHFHPWGIAISQDGEVYVTDMKSHIVLMFGTTGDLGKKFGAAELKKPYGIALTADEKILVVDMQRCCVCIFYQNGILSGRYGCSVGGLTEFNAPRQISVKSNGDWIIADCENQRLIIINHGANPPRSVSVSDGNRPIKYFVRGVEVDEEDNIYVTAVSQRRKFPPWSDRRFVVFMYNSEYTYQGCISKHNEMHMPRGMCVTLKNDNKFLLVVSCNGIHQYKLPAEGNN